MDVIDDIRSILDVLPHRYPFVLVDRVLSIIPGERITALKNVTINEPFFQGHFPENPVMPGLLIVEGMVQAGGLLLSRTIPKEKHGSVCFTGVDKVRFRKTVIPGDQLVFEVEIARMRSRMVIMSAVSMVAEKRVAEAKLLALIGGRK